MRRRLATLEPRDSTGCAATYLVYKDGYYDPFDPPEVILAHARRATALAPEIAENWLALANRLAARPRSDRAEVEATLAEGLRHVPHPLQRATLYLQVISLRSSWSDTAGARRLTTTLLPALARDGRPGLQFIASQLQPREPWNHLAAIRAYTAAHDWNGRSWELRALGKWHLDHGNPAAAIAPLDSAVWLADSVGRPWPQLLTRMQRGRGEARIGQAQGAERDLHAALVAGVRAPDAYFLAETWHNLAHLYEGEGRWAEAAAAADSFVALTRPMRYEPLRMMSLHDAGMIRWKAGWHAAAAANFAEMVRVVDEEQRAADYYWAGEYFERTGDLHRALAYYETGLAQEPPCCTRALRLAGLARVFEALGKDDSAARAAVAHDSLIAEWTPLEHPLLPRLLAREGRAPAAVELAARWADHQLRAGNVEGAALATLEVADLSLAAGKPADALGAARRADSLAQTLHLVTELERAGQIRGEALIALGDRAAGLAALTEAATVAERHPTTDAVFDTHLALGDGLAVAGRAAPALAAYDRAARSVEAVTARLPDDLDRVGYRDRHLRPFEGALRILLAAPPSPARTEALLLWSERRKAAALALATAGTSLRPQPLAALERRLGPDEALIDYVLAAPDPAALVVTRAGARLVPLGASTDAITDLAARLTRPLRAVYGGQLDLARARFDLSAAARLYEVVLAPLRPALGGATRLVIAPDGALCGVPFAALVTALPAAADSAPYLQARYVLDDFEIAYVPSPQWLHRAEDLHGAHLLLLVRDVPGGAAEATAVRAAWPASTVLTGSAATERAVQSLAPAAGIVHFATHAEANDADPLASHLRLARDGPLDGYFHLNEIAAAHLRARLIVLSACATLSGRLAPGEGLLGLARAFLLGGAQGVVATEWPVGATTGPLMGSFYGRLAQGTVPAAALRDAELSLRRDPRTAHPFYWGGFVLVEGATDGAKSPPAE